MGWFVIASIVGYWTYRFSDRFVVLGHWIRSRAKRWETEPDGLIIIIMIFIVGASWWLFFYRSQDDLERIVRAIGEGDFARILLGVILGAVVAYGERCDVLKNKIALLSAGGAVALLGLAAPHLDDLYLP
jgi:hypothetical protein